MHEEVVTVVDVSQGKTGGGHAPLLHFCSLDLQSYNIEGMAKMLARHAAVQAYFALRQLVIKANERVKRSA